MIFDLTVVKKIIEMVGKIFIMVVIQIHLFLPLWTVNNQIYFVYSIQQIKACLRIHLFLVLIEANIECTVF